MKKRLLSLVLALVLCLGLLTLPASAAGITRTKSYTPGQFTDVAADAWYAGSVKDAYELGLMSGSSATTFNPGGMFTLAEAATIAARMHNLYNGGNGVLPASAGAWYQSAVDYCVNNGIFAKDDFDGFTRNATRSEMAQIMAAALPDSAWTAINSVKGLPDVFVGVGSGDAIYKLYNAGVFTGSDAYGTFQPNASITRAEVAAIAARCADTSLRKTLSLTPVTRTRAPELISGAQSYTMSNGRLKFKDPNTGKYGYLDGNGNVRIQAVYDSAEDFVDGYAVVGQNGKKGIIDTDGMVTTPIEYDRVSINNFFNNNSNYLFSHSSNIHNWYVTNGTSYSARSGLVINGRLVTPVQYYEIKYFGDGLYQVRMDRNGKYGVINSAGQVILSNNFSNELTYNGIYFFVSAKEDGGTLHHIYSTSGQWLNAYTADDFKTAQNSRLFAVKEGNKWAVATIYGKITEAVYDSVDLHEDSDFAIVKYGNQTGVVGLNGVILSLGDYDGIGIDGDYYTYAHDGRSYLCDSTRVLWSTEDPYSGAHLWLDSVRGNYALFASQWRTKYCYNLQTGEQCGSYADRVRGDLYFVSMEEGWMVIDPNGQSYGPYKGYKWYGDDCVFTTDDGREDWFDCDTGRFLGSYSRYTVNANDVGKPCVYYGNDTVGYTPVIEYYQSGLYYDQISELGEGYYACRFNTTWYLEHV